MNHELETVVRLNAARCSTFSELASRCLGAWPVAVAECLAGMASAPGPDGANAGRLLQDAFETAPTALSVVRGLPIEHPLDGDWRFAPNAPRVLLRRLLDAVRTGGTILLACVPTLVLFAEDQGLAHRCVVAVRRNDPVADALCRLAPHAAYRGFDDLEGLEAEAAMIDPPWYDDVALPLVQRVAAGVREGGTVLISGPDHLTSASRAQTFAARDRGAWSGLLRVGRPTRVRYRTPGFEARALAAAGIRNVPAFWRTGLVREFHRSGPLGVLHGPSGSHGGWLEVPFGVHRLWIRPEAATGEVPQIIVADTVSRTSPLRAYATAWTSANTVVIGGTHADILSLGRAVNPQAGALRARLADLDARPCWQHPSIGTSAVASTIAKWENDLRPSTPDAMPSLETSRWHPVASSPFRAA